MRTLNRGGFTLIELVVGAALLVILAAMVVALVRGAARVATRATGLLAADRALLTLRGFAQEELRDASVVDIAVTAPTRLLLARPIGEGTACSDLGGAVLLPDAHWTGTRPPEGGRDDAWLLVDDSVPTWLRLPIDSAGRARCPLDGAPAARVVVAPHPGVAAQVRIVEPVELSAYASAGTDWFGLTPANHGSAVQPFAGPLTPGATRFAARPNQLEVQVTPRGVPATTVLIPLGPPP